MRKFKLTGAFLIIAAVTFAVAAMIILKVSNSQEERSVSTMTSVQSARDARLLAASLSRTLSEEIESAGDGTQSGLNDSASVSEFLSESDIIGVALYELDGRSSWTSDGRVISMTDNPLFEAALAGEIVSGLIRGEQLENVPNPVDIVETLVPFLGAETNSPVQVLGVRRDVTTVLSTRIGDTRTAMFRATFLSLGGGFALLLVFIVVADRAIWRSKVGEVRKERQLGYERIATTRLDIENAELQKLNDDRRKLISLVSHELRTPLTSLLVFTEIMQRRQSGPDAENNLKHLDVIKRSGDRLLRMIEQMLDLSRLESTSLTLDEAEFDVSDLVEETVQRIEPILHAKQQTIQVRGDVSDCVIRADRNRLDQVLVNLLSNASKYSAPGASVQLETMFDGDNLHISVHDQGIGVAEEDSSKIFDKFFRADSEDVRAVTGTGLGLSISKTIVEQHHGEITVSSEPGEGSVFSFWVPLGVQRTEPIGQPVLQLQPRAPVI